LVAGIAFTFALVSVVVGQSQEPKPPLPATPVTPISDGTAALPSSGVSGASWIGPNWGVRIDWDPSVWSVEDEFVTDGYDGLRLGTPLSTVYVEAYEGFSGDPRACLESAEEEVRARENVGEVTAIEGGELPSAAADGVAQLYGLVVTLEDGTPVRAAEFVNCRTLVPGEAVLELTWQTSIDAFNDEFGAVEALLGALEVSAAEPGVATPVRTENRPAPPIATPVA
jgi:hypothetical protein